MTGLNSRQGSRGNLGMYLCLQVWERVAGKAGKVKVAISRTANITSVSNIPFLHFPHLWPLALPQLRAWLSPCLPAEPPPGTCGQHHEQPAASGSAPAAMLGHMHGVGDGCHAASITSSLLEGGARLQQCMHGLGNGG
eukprot:1157521-Pelagomonas_calceolata.AAC.12